MNSSMCLNGFLSSACNLRIQLNIEKVKDILFMRNVFFNLIKDKSVSGSWTWLETQSISTCYVRHIIKESFFYVFGGDTICLSVKRLLKKQIDIGKKEFE